MQPAVRFHGRVKVEMKTELNFLERLTQIVFLLGDLGSFIPKFKQQTWSCSCVCAS